LGEFRGLGIAFEGMAQTPIVLSIAGFDPSSGAGITADIKTAAAFGCYAVACITAMTVQSTQGVFAVRPFASEIVRETLRRLQQDFDIAAVRVGMLGTGSVAEEVADFLEREKLPNVVLDPVIRSSSGTQLLDQEGLEVLRRRLLPVADLITPNIDEAAILAEAEPLPANVTLEAAAVRMEELVGRLRQMGSRGIVITGGHLSQPMDYLSVDNSRAEAKILVSEHVTSNSTHGTGCAYATATACLLARGRDPLTAATQAQRFVRDAIEKAYPVGRGTGPVNHLFRFAEHPKDEPDTKTS